MQPMERIDEPWPERPGGFSVGGQLDRMTSGWSGYVWRGVLAILFGIAAFAWPRITLLALVWLFGAYVLVDGIIALINAFGGRSTRRRIWPQVLMGILGICVGVLAFAAPAAVGTALLFFVGAWALVMGVLLIAASISLRKEMRHEWILAVAGVLALIFGFYMFAAPIAGALGMIFWIAAFAILFGIMLIAAGLRLRKLAHEQRAIPTSTTTIRSTTTPTEQYGTTARRSEVTTDRPTTDRPSAPVERPRAPDWPRTTDRPKSTDRPGSRDRPGTTDWPGRSTGPGMGDRPPTP